MASSPGRRGWDKTGGRAYRRDNVSARASPVPARRGFFFPVRLSRKYLFL